MDGWANWVTLSHLELLITANTNKIRHKIELRLSTHVRTSFTFFMSVRNPSCCAYLSSFQLKNECQVKICFSSLLTFECHKWLRTTGLREMTFKMGWAEPNSAQLEAKTESCWIMSLGQSVGLSIGQSIYWLKC